MKFVGQYTIETQSDEPACKVLFVEMAIPEEKIPEDHVTVDDLVASLSAIPGMGEQIRSARTWVADKYFPAEISIRTLRLRKGLTQSELADKIGSSQPHVARIERGNFALQIDTMEKLCAILNVDMNTLAKAFRREAV